MFKIREIDKFGLMIFSFLLICVVVIIKESVDVNKIVFLSMILCGYYFFKMSDGKSFEIKSFIIKIGIISILEGFLKIDYIFRFILIIMKKIGMKKL